MKKITLIIVLAISFSFSSCNNSTPINSVVGSKAIKSEIYICTMHPEIQVDTAGDCPECGMPLVKKEPSDSTNRHNQSDTSHVMN